MPTASLAARNPTSGPESALAKRLKKLPPYAQAKIERLRRAETRSQAITDGLATAIEREREARDEVRRELGFWDRAHRPAFFRHEENPQTGEIKAIELAEDPERTAIVRRIDGHTAELQRLQGEMAAVARTPTEPITSWLLAQDPFAEFVSAEAALPKLARGDTLAAALERNNADQRRLADELASIRNAPRTIAEAKAAMRGEIEGIAARGRPSVNGLFNGDGVGWSQETVQAGAYGAHNNVVGFIANDAFALVVWTHKDAIIKALDAEIEREGDDTNAISADAQKVKIIELEARLLALRRQNEAIIDRVEADGAGHIQRTCTDPLVLLGIERAR